MRIKGVYRKIHSKHLKKKVGNSGRPFSLGRETLREETIGWCLPLLFTKEFLEFCCHKNESRGGRTKVGAWRKKEGRDK